MYHPYYDEQQWTSYDVQAGTTPYSNDWINDINMDTFQTLSNDLYPDYGTNGQQPAHQAYSTHQQHQTHPDQQMNQSHQTHPTHPTYQTLQSVPAAQTSRVLLKPNQAQAEMPQQPEYREERPQPPPVQFRGINSGQVIRTIGGTARPSSTLYRDDEPITENRRAYQVQTAPVRQPPPAQHQQRFDASGLPQGRRIGRKWSFPNMVAWALQSSQTGELPVAQIYDFICQQFPHYEHAPAGWKNSVRHALSKSGIFHKNEVGTEGRMERRRCLWSILPEKMNKVVNELDKQFAKNKDHDAMFGNGDDEDDDFDSGGLPAVKREHKYTYRGRGRPVNIMNDPSEDAINVSQKRPTVMAREAPKQPENQSGSSQTIRRFNPYTDEEPKSALAKKFKAEAQAHNPIADPSSISLFDDVPGGRGGHEDDVGQRGNQRGNHDDEDEYEESEEEVERNNVMQLDSDEEDDPAKTFLRRRTHNRTETRQPAQENRDEGMYSRAADFLNQSGGYEESDNEFGNDYQPDTVKKESGSFKEESEEEYEPRHAEDDYYDARLENDLMRWNARS